MSSPAPVNIPIKLTVDGSQVDQATREVEVLEQRVARLQARLEQTARKEFKQPTATHEDVEGLARSTTPGDFYATAPKTAAAFEQYNRSLLTEQQYQKKKQGLSDDDLRARFDENQRRKQLFAQWEAAYTQNTSFVQRLGANLSASMTPSTVLSMVVGGPKSAGAVFSQALLSSVLGGGRGAGLAARALAPAASAAGGGVATAGTADATAAGGGGILGGLGGLIAGVAAALGGGYLFYNSKEAEVHTAQNALFANTSNGGPPSAQDAAFLRHFGGNVGVGQDQFGQMLGGGSRFYYDMQTANGVYTGLANAGVTGGQLNQQGQNALALARMTGYDPSQTQGIISGMAVQGGMSGEDTAIAMQAMDEQSKITGISLNRMVDSLKDFEDTSGGVAMNLKTINGLAAIQALVGPGISAGSLVGPALGSTGANAFGIAGALGLTPDQFGKMQGLNGGGADSAGYWDQVGKTVRRMAGGYTGDARTYAAEAYLQGTGTLNLAQYGPRQQQQIINDLLSGKPGAGQNLANTIASQEHFLSGGDFRSKVSGLAGDMVSNVDKAKLEALYLIYQGTNQTTSAVRDLSAALTGKSHPGGGAGPAPGTQASLAVQHGGMPHTSFLGGRLGMSQALVTFPDGTTMPLAAWNAMPSGQTPAGGNGPSGYGVGNWSVYSGASNSPFSVPSQYQSLYLAASKKFGVPLSILLSQGALESGFNPNALSGAGAEGIAQFMPGTFATYAKRFRNVKGTPFYGDPNPSPYNASEAIYAQAAMMQDLLKEFGGNMQQALAAYNAGPGNTFLGQGYASAIREGAARDKIEVNVKVENRTGQHLGSAQVNHSRKPTGHKSYGQPHHTAPPRRSHGKY